MIPSLRLVAILKMFAYEVSLKKSLVIMKEEFSS